MRHPRADKLPRVCRVPSDYLLALDFTYPGTDLTRYSLLHSNYVYLIMPLYHIFLKYPEKWLHTNQSNRWFRRLSFEARLYIKLLFVVPNLRGDYETGSRL
jgi:hypothetical protein